MHSSNKKQEHDGGNSILYFFIFISVITMMHTILPRKEEGEVYCFYDIKEKGIILP